MTTIEQMEYDNWLSKIPLIEEIKIAEECLPNYYLQSINDVLIAEAIANRNCQIYLDTHNKMPSHKIKKFHYSKVKKQHKLYMVAMKQFGLGEEDAVQLYDACLNKLRDEEIARYIHDTHCKK